MIHLVSDTYPSSVDALPCQQGREDQTWTGQCTLDKVNDWLKLDHKVVGFVRGAALLIPMLSKLIN